MKVWVVSVGPGPEGAECEIDELCVCSTEAKAVAALARWCRSRWRPADEAASGPMPATPEAAVEHFFRRAYPAYNYGINEYPVDATVEDEWWKR